MRHRNPDASSAAPAPTAQAMFSNMAASLFKHELIRTTLPKAKELRRVAEPLITLAKTDGVANRRLAFARLRDKEAVGKLFVELGPRYAPARAVTCASSSAVSALATMRRWPTSNSSTARTRPPSKRSPTVDRKRPRPSAGVFRFCGPAESRAAACTLSQVYRWLLHAWRMTESIPLLVPPAVPARVPGAASR